jgi:hypothetical protein
MLPGHSRTSRASFALRLQHVLYSRSVRRLGLFLSERRLPAATVNTYLQRVIPQPKFPLDALAPGIAYGDEAAPVYLVWLDKGDDRLSALSLETAIDRLLEPGDRAFGFRPYPLLVDELGRWSGRNWLEEERDILRAGLAGCRMLHWQYGGERWWERVTTVVIDPPSVGLLFFASLSVKSA